MSVLRGSAHPRGGQPVIAYVSDVELVSLYLLTCSCGWSERVEVDVQRADRLLSEHDRSHEPGADGAA